MGSDIAVKICGLTRAEDIAACVDAGVRYLGLNFFPPSPRSVSPERAAELVADVPAGVAKVALVVDADDATLDEITSVVPLDMIQLHGGESPERVAEVKARYGLPVMKVVGVADAPDLEKLERYVIVADQILLDAKPPKDGPLPGGNGLTFDWRLIAGHRWPVPWMLAGGLTPQNVAAAIETTGARQVDLASGVETAPGIKDRDLIAAFMRAASTAA